MEALDMLTKVIKDTRPGGHHAVMDQLRDSMKQHAMKGNPEEEKQRSEQALKEKLREAKAKRTGAM